MTPHEALTKAVQVLGGQSAMAAACGEPVKQQHVYNWLNRDKKLPPHHALKIQRATADKGDEVKASQLCPEVFADDEVA